MGQAHEKNYWRFSDDFLGKEKIIKRCKFWKWSLNFGKVTEPQFGGDKIFFGPRKKFQARNWVCHVLFANKIIFFVKCGLGSRSNMPDIGGSRPVPSLSILSTERRGTAMYYTLSPQKVPFWPQRALSGAWSWTSAGEVVPVNNTDTLKVIICSK